MAKRRGLTYFLRLWAVSRGLYKSQWRWRRVLGVLWFVRVARKSLGKSTEIISTTKLRPGTSIYVGTGDVPVRVKRGGREIQVINEEVAS